MNHRFWANKAHVPGGASLRSPTVCARRRGALLCIVAATTAVLGGATLDSARAQCTSTAPGNLPNAFPGISNATLLNATASGISSTSGAVLGAINTMDTAFLAQGSAFVTNPPSKNPDQTVAGVWFRQVGGQTTTNSTGTVNGALIFNSIVPGTTNCDTKVRQEYGGVQAGMDIGKLNLGGGGGANIHFGVTGGYALSNSNDSSVPTSAEVQALFAGGYATLAYGSFFADLMVRGNFYQIQHIESPFLEMHDGAFNANGISVSGSAGYNIAIPSSNSFIEPSAGFVYSLVKADSLTIPGNIAVGGFVSPGVLQFDDIKSTLGRVGVRVGTNLTSGNVIWQPFLTASVWHEFQGASVATYSGNLSFFGTTFVSGFQVSSSRLGTYGQYSAGAAAQLANTGWAGYARLDLREGSNIQGIGVNGGLRYSFTP